MHKPMTKPFSARRYRSLLTTLLLAARAHAVRVCCGRAYAISGDNASSGIQKAPPLASESVLTEKPDKLPWTVAWAKPSKWKE
jgi:hypothetical protein